MTAGSTSKAITAAFIYSLLIGFADIAKKRNLQLYLLTEPLKDFLRRKMPEILAKLQIKQGGHSGKGKILKAIEGLLRKRFVSTTPSTLRKSSEEEKVNRERNEELRKELATSVAARKLFAGFGKNRTPKPAEELKPQE